MDATERLLGEAPLVDLSVAKICAEASVSRGTFYLHFESKHEVVAELLNGIMSDMYDLLGPLQADNPSQPDADSIREVLTRSADLWQQHSAVFRAVHENYVSVPELRGQWRELTEQFTDAILSAVGAKMTARDDTERHRICASLVWTTEHLFYISSTNSDDTLPSPTVAADVLTRIWVGSIFGTSVD
ncbi:TetR/AcrR family transcriptional regulator [Nocardia sp. R16R-3T]